MLRFIVLLLILVNGAYLAWAQGHLAGLGLAPAAQTEPHRVQAQIKPGAVRLLSASEAKRVEALAAAPPPQAPECLQSALLDAAQASVVKAAMASLPAGSFSLQEGTEPARWIVYMGKYATADALAKKKTELRDLKVSHEALKNASLEPGLSLGLFPTQAQANAALAQLVSRGVRTARVVQEWPDRTGFVLKLFAANDSVLSQLAGIGLQLNADLSECKP